MPYLTVPGDDFHVAFRGLGRCLDDLGPTVFNDFDMRDPRRRAERERGVAPLSRRMRAHDPTVHCVVMQSILPAATVAVDAPAFDAQVEECRSQFAAARSASPGSLASFVDGGATAF